MVIFRQNPFTHSKFFFLSEVTETIYNLSLFIFPFKIQTFITLYLHLQLLSKHIPYFFKHTPFIFSEMANKVYQSTLYIFEDEEMQANFQNNFFQRPIARGKSFYLENFTALLENFDVFEFQG